MYKRQVVDPAAGPLAEVLVQALPLGADYIFDTTGKVEVIMAATEVAAPLATVGLVGVPTDFSATLPLSIIGLMVKGLKAVSYKHPTLPTRDTLYTSGGPQSSKTKKKNNIDR